jgi:hypothetical protein
LFRCHLKGGHINNKNYGKLFLNALLKIYMKFSKTNSKKTLPELIPRLAVLENVKNKFMISGKLPKLKNTFIIGVQHGLASTGSLLRAIKELGVPPENMFFSGKIYSSNTQVIKAINDMGIHMLKGSPPVQLGKWQQAHAADVAQVWDLAVKRIKSAEKVDRIIILDDGGACIQATPSHLTWDYPVICIEQTRGGIYDAFDGSLPLINVAQSAAKRILEAPLIQKPMINKLKPYLETINKEQSTIGIVGYGYIGKALADQLVKKGYRVLIYDDNNDVYPKELPSNLKIASSIAALFLDSSYIFGCTGRDITKDIDLFKINNQNRTLISCSSADVEFNTLLNSINEANKILKIDPLSDITCINSKNTEIRIINGGFPANFDRKPVSVPNKHIAITQGLLLCAFMQSVWATYHGLSPWKVRQFKNLMLVPGLQNYIIEEWRKTLEPTLQSQIPFDILSSMNVIKAYSVGINAKVMVYTNLQGNIHEVIGNNNQ